MLKTLIAVILALMSTLVAAQYGSTREGDASRRAEDQRQQEYARQRDREEQRQREAARERDREQQRAIDESRRRY